MEEKRKEAQKQGKDAIDEDDPEKVGIVLLYIVYCTWFLSSYIYMYRTSGIHVVLLSFHTWYCAFAGSLGKC